MRTAGLLLLLAIAARAGELETAEVAVRKVAAGARPAVVTVITPERRDFDLTGVVIGPGVVLTVRSPLVRGKAVPGGIGVRYPGKGAAVRAELIRDDAATNTVLYKTTGARVKPIQTARAADVSHGMWVLLVGNAFGRESTPTLSLGVISAIARRKGAVEAFHTSALVNPGSIGAPVVDLSGDLVGIAAPSVTPDGQQTVVIPFDRIRRAYRALGGAAAKAVGREPPPRRFRNHIVDQLGPVLEDAAKRAGRALVAVRALPRPDDKPPPPPDPKKKPKGPPRPVRVPGERAAWDRSSGLVVGSAGLILCPLRVTGWPGKPRALEVDLLDGQTFPAQILGKDERLRLALLKVGASDLPVLEPAPAEAHRAGRFAVALGYPHARIANTPQLTFGVLSRTNALGRVHPAFRALQTDAGVSGANRGGPLVDIDGKLLGVLLDVNDSEPSGYALRAKARYEGNAGLGFAVPWAVLETLVPRLEKGLVLKPGFLGVRTVDGKGGLEVVAVVAENSRKQPTGAKAAGVSKGDVLVSIGGRPLKALKDLRRILGAFAAGDKVKLELLREGKRVELDVTLGEP